VVSRPDPMDRIEFPVDHLCEVDLGAGDTHIVSGWQSPTPGLAVFHNAGANVPCHPEGDPDDPMYGDWLVWDTTDGRGVVMSTGDPESAMRSADLLGRYETRYGPRDAPPYSGGWLAELLDDMAQRGEL
jgi:hypothetical protein